MMAGLPIDLEITGHTDIGLKRSINQDAFKIVEIDEENPFYILLVADGVGGNLPRGEVASATAIKAFCESLELTKSLLEDNVRRALTLTNRAVSEQATVLGIDIIGTTIAGIVIDKWGEGVQFNIGDTRIYRIRNSQADIISHDDVTVTIKEDGNAKPKSKLNSFLGQPKAIEPNIYPIKVKPDDNYLICSDGFWGLVQQTDDLLELFDGKSTEEISQQCIEMTLQKGAPDNVTVIVVRSLKTDSTEPEIPIVANRTNDQKSKILTETEGRASPKRNSWLLGVAIMIVVVIAILLWVVVNSGLLIAQHF
ncbi:MAG: serine/threonine-protein phosphatase [Anaerolineae bacterium]|nr:serine/threonine-protein phosphatase [Anaerolineae bacterium]MCA9891679.1 serine/threonine-protein phosphatase [Anaerolineae bacterium]